MSTSRFAQASASPVAGLLALVSLGGLLSPAVYARETPAWVAQAISQDWFDLAIAAPWIAICGLRARTSYRWGVLLAGAYGYAVYELAIYAFAVHFNALFLVYCGALGLASYALIASIGELIERREPVDPRAAHLAGAYLIGIAVVFAALWLVEDLPAIVRGAPPASLVETGLFTNPVHVIDLAFVLPAHAIAGVWLWRRRPRGEVYAAVVLAFGALMSASIGGMLLAIRIDGGDVPLPVIAAMFAMTAATAAVLRRLFHPAVTPARARSIPMPPTR